MHVDLAHSKISFLNLRFAFYAFFDLYFNQPIAHAASKKVIPPKVHAIVVAEIPNGLMNSSMEDVIAPVDAISIARISLRAIFCSFRAKPHRVWYYSLSASMSTMKESIDRFEARDPGTVLSIASRRSKSPTFWAISILFKFLFPEFRVEHLADRT